MGRPNKRNLRRVSIFKEVEQTPSRYTGSLCPTNLEEEKQRFFQTGATPQFKLKESDETVEKISHRKIGKIRTELLSEAQAILDMVRDKFGDGCAYAEATYGKKISSEQATKVLAKYLSDHGCAGEITIYWAPDLTCSARMMWHGPNLKYNKPEARKYTLLIRSAENGFLREKGIHCLADHEIGTHYLRMINDGLQPWFSDRQKFGLRTMRCRELMTSEEGLAAVNTVVNASHKYLFGPAFLYYAACKAETMGFQKLYNHLATYVPDREQRWKTVMRLKRCLPNPSGLGGYGNDQCYFEGAVDLLRRQDQIDFSVLYSGKITFDEVDRLKRLARTDCIRLPKFIRDIENYRKTLRHISQLNGLTVNPDTPIKRPKCMTSPDILNLSHYTSNESGESVVDWKSAVRHEAQTAPSNRSSTPPERTGGSSRCGSHTPVLSEVRSDYGSFVPQRGRRGSITSDSAITPVKTRSAWQSSPRPEAVATHGPASDSHVRRKEPAHRAPERRRPLVPIGDKVAATTGATRKAKPPSSSKTSSRSKRKLTPINSKSSSGRKKSNPTRKKSSPAKTAAR